MPDRNVGQNGISELEAQRFSGLSRSTLRKLVSDGQLRATKIGMAGRIDKHSLESYMRNHGYAEQLRLFD